MQIGADSMNNMSEHVNELMAALSKAQGKIQPACKDKANPFFKSKYADLSSVWDACRSALTDNGLAVIQTINRTDTGMTLVTTLGHSSGQWIKSEMPIITAKNDPQTLGSAITYFRRYSLSAIVGVSPEDDDGEKAQSPFRKPADVKPEPRKISDIECSDLANILDECDGKYKELFMRSLKAKFNTDKLSDIPTSEYSKIKESALNNMHEMHKKQSELVGV